MSILEGRLFGLLSLMKAENPVQGVVDAEGRYRLSGSIRTRMSAYPFEGEGLLLPESVELMLRCAGITLPLRGTRREECPCGRFIA